MLNHPIIVEYWQDEDGRFFAESLHHPISAQGESLAALRAGIADGIRDCFRGVPLPSVYDLVPRNDGSVRQRSEATGPVADRTPRAVSQ